MLVCWSDGEKRNFDVLKVSLLHKFLDNDVLWKEKDFDVVKWKWKKNILVW